MSLTHSLLNFCHQSLDYGLVIIISICSRVCFDSDWLQDLLLSLECFIKSLVIAHMGLLSYSTLWAHSYRQTTLQSLWDLPVITVSAGTNFSARTCVLFSVGWVFWFFSLVWVYFPPQKTTPSHIKLLLPQKMLTILI